MKPINRKTTEAIASEDNGLLADLLGLAQKRFEDLIDAHNSISNRAGVLLGFASISIAYVVNFLEKATDTWWVAAVVVTWVSSFFATAKYCSQAFNVQGLRDLPRPSDERYTGLYSSPSAEFRQQLIVDIDKAADFNRKVLARRSNDLQSAVNFFLIQVAWSLFLTILFYGWKEA